MTWGISEEQKTITEYLPELQCPNCHDIGQVHASVYCKYFHVMFIPTFSIGKKSKFFCCSCKTKIKKKFIPVALNEAIQDLKETIKIPRSHFTGTMIFVVLLIAMIAIIATDDSIEPDIAIKHPQVNDIYSVHVSKEDNLYSTWKVIHVDSNSVYVFKNEVEIEGIWDFTKAKNRASTQRFIPDTVAYSPIRLFRMYKDGFITDVDRELVN